MPTNFDSFFTNEDQLNNIINESWFDQKGFFNTCDIKMKKEYFNLWIGHKIDSLLSYYGYENIFGTSYFPFEIENDL